MLVDALFDRFVRRLRKSPRQEHDEFSAAPNRKTPDQPKLKHRGRSPGMFDGANNFVLTNSTFIDRPQITQNFVAGKPGLDPVLERIVPYTELNAAMDSSARFPPPTCHPGTRLKIGDRLYSWLTNHQRQWNMMWLHGPAGTGKSAVAQTFAERCDENGRLGASFFFSQPNNRNSPNTIIPSLVYQLAVCIPDYKSLVTTQISNDPELLRKTRRTQFKKLIVKPFSFLQVQGYQSVQQPFLIVLDGLDECDGENAQREILEMISEVVQLKPDFPLVWLICSRPEAHLKYLFSRTDFTVSCGREELVIDAESIVDVNLYLRDGLAGIQHHFPDITTPTWPSEDQFNNLSQKASGHFAFASTAIRYIGDLAYAAPMARLDDLLSFLEGFRVGHSNPLEGLDALYTRIFLDVPNEVLPTLRLILGFLLYFESYTASTVCNLFYVDQTTFYRTFRKLYSVIDVPSPEAAPNTPLRFYHASFSDYLRDPRRSGGFVVAEEDFTLEFAKLCLSWYKTDLALFHTVDGLEFNSLHSHGILPGLTWVSDENRSFMSFCIAEITEGLCWYACWMSGKWDEVILSQIQPFNFRYIQKRNLGVPWCNCMNKLWELDSSSGVIRTEPRSEVDRQLLEFMKSMIEPILNCRPASFPFSRFPIGGLYFLLGHDSDAIVCWTTGCRS